MSPPLTPIHPIHPSLPRDIKPLAIQILARGDVADDVAVGLTWLMTWPGDVARFFGTTSLLPLVGRCVERKQRELLHPSAGGRSSNKNLVSPRSIHEEEDSSLT
ncbi:hypothetical protein LguiA_000813 [Lonicera macranthoides]